MLQRQHYMIRWAQHDLSRVHLTLGKKRCTESSSHFGQKTMYREFISHHNATSSTDVNKVSAIEHKTEG